MQQRKSFFETLENRSLLATLYWQGDVSNSWNNVNNWTTNPAVDTVPGAVPAIGDTLNFDTSVVNFNTGAAQGFTPNNDIAGLSNLTLSLVDGAASDFTLSGLVADLSAAGISNNTTVGTGATISMPVNVAASTIDVIAGNLALTGVVGGTSLTKSSAGTLLLSGQNTFSGGATVNAGTLNLQTGAAGAVNINPLGTGALTVNNTGNVIVSQSSAPLVGLSNALAMSWFNTGAATAMITGIGNNTATGGLLGAAPQGSKLLTGAINFGSDALFQASSSGPLNGPILTAGDNYMFLYRGYFTPAVSGTYQFGVGNQAAGANIDDEGAIYLDMNGNGLFDTVGGEQVAYRATAAGSAAGAAVNLTAGVAYPIAVAFREGTGSANFTANVQRTSAPVAAWTNINAGTGSGVGTFTAYGTPTGGALGNNPVNVSGTTSIEVQVANFGFAALNVAAGSTLNLNGTGAGANGTVTFGSANLAGAATINTNTAHSQILGVVSQAVADTITKSGGNILTLAGANTYAGATAITGGTLRVGNQNALGTIAGGTTISGGGTLDIHGFRVGPDGNEPISVEGTGVGGTGAIVNSRTAPALPVIRNLTMTNNATFSSNSRWDIRDDGADPVTFDMNGFTLTKVGTAELCIVNGVVVDPGSVNVNTGIFRFEGSTDFDGTGTISVAAGASLDFWQNTQSFAVNIALANTANLTTNDLTGAGPTLTGTITLTGTSTWNLEKDSTFSGQITGAGGFNKNTGTGVLTLTNNANNYSGTTAVNAGTLVVTQPNALGSTAAGTTVAAGATLRYDATGGALSFAAEPLFLNGQGVGNAGALQSATNDVTLSGPIALMSDTFIGSNTAGRTLTINSAVNNAVDSDLTLLGAGSFDINGDINDKGYSLTPFTARVFVNATAPNLLDQTVVTNFINGTTVPNRTNVLNGPLQLANLAAFNALFTPSLPLADNFNSVFETTLTVTVAGTYTFAATNNDDGAMVWIKPSANPAFAVGDRLYAAVLGNSNTAVATRALTPGTYTLVYVHRENAGSEAFTGRIGGLGHLGITDGTALPIVNPAAVAATSHLVKTGAGNANLSGNNSYTGVTLVHQGTLTVDSNNALGASAPVSGDITVGGLNQHWQVGLDNNTQTEFSVEGGAVNAAPGSAAVKDDDWYFAGTYPAPIGVLGADETPLNFERAITNTDHTRRIHFNLAAVEVDDTYQLQIDLVSSNFTGGSIPIQVLVNGVTVHTATISADGLVNTPNFSGSSVNMTTGDNVVTITRTTGAGTGTHVQFDFIRLNRQGLVFAAANTQLEPGTTLTMNGGITTPESLVVNGALGIFVPTGANTVSGTVNMLTNTTYDVSGGASLTLTNAVQGAGDLSKTGAGVMTLAGTNTYTGATNVNAGLLTLQNGLAILDTAGAVNVALGATLQLLNSETVSSYVGAGDAIGSNDSLLALGANTLTANGSAAIANVTTASGAGIVAGASITDNDDDNNVTGPNIYLQAGNGIGTAVDPLETAVANIQLNNTTSGDVNVLNSNAGALLTVSDLRAIGFGARNIGGAVTVVNASPLTIAADVNAAGAILLTATDSAAIGDDLTVNPGVSIQSAGSTVTLNAGDIATVPVTALLGAAGTVVINIDAGNADAGVGGTLNFAADVDAPLAIFNGLNDANGDTFNVRPDQDVGDVLTPIQVFGLAPNANPNGDALVLDITGLGIPTLTLGPGVRNGSFSFGALAASLTYNNIENVSTNPALPYHLVLDMRFSGFENGAADTILAQLDATGTTLLLDVNAANVFTGPDNVIQSLTIIGSNDADALTIQETAGGLPRFGGAAPVVNNTGIGGSTSNGSHLNGSADLALETLIPGGTPWDAADVTLHFDGGVGGSDSLTVNYTTANSTGYFSDANDAGNSGNVSTSPGAFPALGLPTLLLSFANVEPLTLSGAGGLMLADATGTAATTSLTVTDIGAQTQIVGNGGFATTSFSGFNAAVVLGGNGSETIDLVSIDNALLTTITLMGGNTNDLLTLPGGDTAADTLRIQSLPATIAATMNGNAGSDLFQLFDGANSVDNIAGGVTVDGTDGSIGGNTDTLTIVNSGGAAFDNALIGAVNAGASAEYFVDGVTAAVVTDVFFRNIDVLNYTGTTFDDTIDARLVNTTPAHDLSTVNLSGWTGADQFLLFTSDQFGGSGGVFTPSGIASGVANVNLYGDAPGNPNAGDGNDKFGADPVGIVGTGATSVGLLSPDTTRMIRPSASTAIAIDGGQPTGLAAPLGDVVGDVNNVDVSALPNTTPVIVSTFSPGAVVATGIQPLTWTQIEDLNLVDQGRLTNVQMGDLFARTTPGADLIQLTRNPTALNPNQVRLRITATIGNYSVSNKTIMYGGDQNDMLTQSNLTIPAEFYGEGGDDYLTGAMNNDWLVGGDGHDRINGSGGDNVIWGDNAPTSADPQPQDAATGGNDQLSGLGGNDVFYGSGGNDSVSSGAGNDYANGGFGNDTLDGHDGDDRLYGGAGNDIISGHGGHDLLSGGENDDRLFGSSGNDVVLGGNGVDLVEGGDGNDLLVSGSVANENSSRTSVANTTTFNPSTYTNGADNDAALLTLLAQWNAVVNDPTGIAAITHDGANDDLFGGTGDDDFCWEAADVIPGTNPADYNGLGMGMDQRINPT